LNRNRALEVEWVRKSVSEGEVFRKLALSRMHAREGRTVGVKKGGGGLKRKSDPSLW